MVNPAKRGTRVWNPEYVQGFQTPLGSQNLFVLLTQIPLLVSMETVGLTSSWLPWCLVLEDLSRLYTARDKQGLQPKLLPLPSCHHLLSHTQQLGMGGDGRTAGGGA